MSKKTETNSEITEAKILRVCKEPQRHEQIAKALGVTTAVTGPLVRAAVAAGKLKTGGGSTRAQTYRAA